MFSPSAEFAAIPGRHPRWRRFLRNACLVAFAVVAAFYSIENWRGARAWKLAQARLTAVSETVDLDSLSPPSVPPEENFCATPSLDGLGGEENESRQKRRRLDRLETRANSTRAPWQILRRDAPDWEAWRVQLEATKHLKPAPDDPDAAKAIVLGFAPHEALFDELIAAARDRRRAAFQPPLYHRITRSNIICSLGMEPYDPFSTLCEAIELRARAALTIGDTERAAALLRVLWRCRQALAADPSEVGHWKSHKIESQARHVLLDGLRVRAWTDDKLLEWQREFGSIDHRQLMIAAKRWELADAVGFLDRFMADRSAGLREWYGDYWDDNSNTPAGLQWGLRLAPRGWLRLHQAAVVNNYLDHAVAPLRDRGLLA